MQQCSVISCHGTKVNRDMQCIKSLIKYTPRECFFLTPRSGLIRKMTITMFKLCFYFSHVSLQRTDLELVHEAETKLKLQNLMECELLLNSS